MGKEWKQMTIVVETDDYSLGIRLREKQPLGIFSTLCVCHQGLNGWSWENNKLEFCNWKKTQTHEFFQIRPVSCHSSPDKVLLQVWGYFNPFHNIFSSFSSVFTFQNKESTGLGSLNIRVNCLKVFRISCHLPLCPRYFSLAENALSLTLTYFDFPEMLFCFPEKIAVHHPWWCWNFQSTLPLAFLWAPQFSSSMPDYPWCP